MIAGVDEAGRGSLAAHLVAAAVVLDPRRPVHGLRDSKLLSAGRRLALRDQILGRALAVGMGRATVAEIAHLNVLGATMLAMARAVDDLGVAPHQVLVDGPHLPDWRHRSRAIVGGDASQPCIAAASICAKVARDEELCALSEVWPEYGLHRHKGYPTAAHRAAIRKHGISAAHRPGFRMV